MKYINAEISLNVTLVGELATRGRYEIRQKLDDKGNKVYNFEKSAIDGSMVKSPAIQLRTLQLPCYQDCSHHTILNNKFVQWAISDDSKPKDMSAGYWKRMPEKMKLKFHIDKYVKDLFGSTEYKYTILE